MLKKMLAQCLWGFLDGEKRKEKSRGEDLGWVAAYWDFISTRRCVLVPEKGGKELQEKISGKVESLPFQGNDHFMLSLKEKGPIEERSI